MAYQVVSWVLKHAPADMSAGEMMVSVVLADYADAHGMHAYPSIAALAQGAHIGERQVIRCLKHLVERGVLAVQQPATNRLPTMYMFPALRGDIADTSRGDKSDTPQEGLGVTFAQPGVTFATSRGDICDTHYIRNIEPPEEPPDLPAIEQPYHMLQVLCDATSRDIRKLTTRERNSQLAVAKRLLKDEVACAEVRGYVGYLLSQHWRTELVTMFTVEKGIGTWRASGAPAAARASPARNGRASAQDFLDLIHEDAHEPPGHAETVIDAAYSVSHGQALGAGGERHRQSVGHDPGRR